MVAIANTTEVRQLAGNRDTDNISDSVITEQITASDALVRLYTSKEDWVSTDLEYPLIKQASELLASSWIRQRFKEKDESERQYKEAMSLLELINRKSESAGTRAVVIKRKPYKSYPLNPSGDYYSSKDGTFYNASTDFEGVEPLED